MQGTRKFRAYVITTVVQTLTVIGALVTGVQFEGNDITAILTLYAATSGAFFVTNFGEHYAKAKATPAPSQA